MITNNDIMKKLRVALSLKDTDIVAILRLAEFEITETELSSFFRREDHPHYRECGDQIVRRFLDGLIVRNRGKKEDAPVVSKTVSQVSGRDPRAINARHERVVKKDTIRVMREEITTTSNQGHGLTDPKRR